MEESHLLEDLRRKNAQRWSTIQELHEKCTNRSVEPSVQVALSVELDMLQSAARPDAIYHTNVSQELVKSYDELRQTIAVLERRKARDVEKLSAMKRMVSEYKSVHEALVSMKSSEQSSPVVAPVDDIETQRRENAWLRDELHYVAQQVHAKHNAKRRRLDQSNESVPTSRQNDSWSIDRFVLELTERYLGSDPYMLTSPLPVESWQIDFLTKCQVLRRHTDNPDLVCLSDYNNANS